MTHPQLKLYRPLFYRTALINTEPANIYYLNEFKKLYLLNPDVNHVLAKKLLIALEEWVYIYIGLKGNKAACLTMLNLVLKRLNYESYKIVDNACNCPFISFYNLITKFMTQGTDIYQNLKDLIYVNEHLGLYFFN